ncbi:unnamed protein product [Somion occarium]|uniref:Uncharacterized protein n=1 Tax=Somion occarium TaxID=3059160 RepID=A0ABP1DYK5_9APHY
MGQMLATCAAQVSRVSNPLKLGCKLLQTTLGSSIRGSICFEYQALAVSRLRFSPFNIRLCCVRKTHSFEDSKVALVVVTTHVNDPRRRQAFRTVTPFTPSSHPVVPPVSLTTECSSVVRL